MRRRPCIQGWWSRRASNHLLSSPGRGDHAGSFFARAGCQTGAKRHVCGLGETVLAQIQLAFQRAKRCVSHTPIIAKAKQCFALRMHRIKPQTLHQVALFPARIRVRSLACLEFLELMFVEVDEIVEGVKGIGLCLGSGHR